ncbi:MAG: adenosylcobinamide amidohydrolase [Fervidicoccaceae archaeon]
MRGSLVLPKRARRLDADTILRGFDSPMEVVSTPPLITPDRPIRGEVEVLVFKRVRTEEVENPIKYYTRVARTLGLKRALMVTTSVSLDDKFSYIRVEKAVAFLYMTASPKPPVCSDSVTCLLLLFGTINAVAVDYQPLSYNALVDLLRTSAEAKVLASIDPLLRCRTWSPETVSDSILILEPSEVNERIAFAGISTNIGRLLDVFSEVSSGCLIPEVNISKAKSLALKPLKRAQQDPNVWALLVVARELDLLGLAGSIPEIAKEELEEDGKKLVADEVIDTALLTYPAGLSGLFIIYRVDRQKDYGIVDHEELGVFMDYVLSALLVCMIVDLLARVDRDEE